MGQGNHYLSAIIFIPAVGAVALVFFRHHTERLKQFALAVTVVDLIASVPLLLRFDAADHRMQFVERVPWIPTFDIHYFVGVDGISLWLVLLTALLSPICVLCSWRAIENRVMEFMMVILLMETAMLGVFSALDFVLFYVFWEAMLIPMYLIIGVWGGRNRIYAAIKFFLYTLAGSLLLLVAIIVLYFTGGRTFDIPQLMGQPYSPQIQFWIFWAFFLAFAIKVPMFPFHTWLPDAHVEAPTAGSVILASVLLKMGAYGFLRFCLPMVPQASMTFSPVILALSVTAILYGAYMALGQEDLKKMIAYSSVSHMGFVTLGIFVFTSQGVEGAILQMINHGITTGALFLLVGMLYDRTHSRLLKDCTAIYPSMPVYATLLVIFSFAAFGLPGTNNFVGEFLILAGSFARNRLMAVLALLGLILTAFYMLWIVREMVYGKVARPVAMGLPDLSLREMVTIIPLAVLVFYIGFHPAPLLSVMHASVDHLLNQAGLVASLPVTEVFNRP